MKENHSTIPNQKPFEPLIKLAFVFSGFQQKWAASSERLYFQDFNKNGSHQASVRTGGGGRDRYHSRHIRSYLHVMVYPSQMFRCVFLYRDCLYRARNMSSMDQHEGVRCVLHVRKSSCPRRWNSIERFYSPEISFWVFWTLFVPSISYTLPFRLFLFCLNSRVNFSEIWCSLPYCVKLR